MNFQTEIETLIRARYPILYIISSEETRVQDLLVDLARRRQKKIFEWSCTTGIIPAGASIQSVNRWVGWKVGARAVVVVKSFAGIAVMLGGAYFIWTAM